MSRVNILSTFKGVMFSPIPTFEYLTEKSQQFMEVKPDEWQRSQDFLSEKGSYTIKFDDGYYDIGFITA